MPGFLGSGWGEDSLLSYPSGTQGPVKIFCTTQSLSETPFSMVTSPHSTLPSHHSASHEPDSKKKLGTHSGLPSWNDHQHLAWFRSKEMEQDSGEGLDTPI